MKEVLARSSDEYQWTKEELDTRLEAGDLQNVITSTLKQTENDDGQVLLASLKLKPDYNSVRTTIEHKDKRIEAAYDTGVLEITYQHPDLKLLTKVTDSLLTNLIDYDRSKLNSSRLNIVSSVSLTGTATVRVSGIKQVEDSDLRVISNAIETCPKRKFLFLEY